MLGTGPSYCLTGGVTQNLQCRQQGKPQRFGREACRRGGFSGCSDDLLVVLLGPAG